MYSGIDCDILKYEDIGLSKKKKKKKVDIVGEGIILSAY